MPSVTLASVQSQADGGPSVRVCEMSDHVDGPVQTHTCTVPASLHTLKLFINETGFFQGNDITRLA